jgi:hypothetical protein
MSDKIFAVSTTDKPEDLGDCFYGTIEQFQDCFCSNEMHTLEDVEYFAKAIFRDTNVIVTEVPQR